MLPMANIGTPEILIVIVIILLLFGASRIPELGKGIAEGINAFRKALHFGNNQEPDEKPQNPDIFKDKK